MKKIVFIFLLFLLLSGPEILLAQGLGQYHSMSLVVSDTLPRAYWLYEPPGYTPGEEWPIVFAFHGFGQFPINLASSIEMYGVADTAKFFIAYPQGLAVYSPYSNQTLMGWNIPGVYIAPHDDVEFVDQMIDDIIAHPDFTIDTNSIFSTGLSMGGELTYLLACNLSERIASFAGVCAQMMDVVMDNCSPDRIISLYHNLGTEDESWPAGGGPGFPQLEGTAEYWAGIANCSLEPIVTHLPDLDPGDDCTVTLLTYDSCYTGYEVLCYRIEGGIHAWPGGQNAGQPGVNNDLHTSTEIWKFFLRNPHPRVYPFCLPEGVVFSSQQQIDDFQVYYPNCTEIQGDVNINGNDITDLGGLNTITSIEGSLSIYGNDVLTNLSGLDNILSIDGDLEIGKEISSFIFGNPLLTSLSGLDNIEHGSIENLTIMSNPLLFECDIDNICTYLLSPDGKKEIHDNAFGCNDSLEIRNACEGVIINELNEINNISSSPNPFTTSTSLSYTLDKPSTVTVSIFNPQGQLIEKIEQEQPSGSQQMQWNAEGLPAGMYYFRIQAGAYCGSGKMIKMK